MSEDINQELLVELRKIRTISRRLCYLIVVFIIVCAVPFFQQRRRQDPASWQQVRAAVDRGDCQKALSMARVLIARQPDYAYGHAYLGYVYLAMDDLTNAEAEYSRAYQLFPDEADQKDLDAVRKRMAGSRDFKLISK
jgi:cytochrome c-type biogenesis protein CcmH/NrfG